MPSYRVTLAIGALAPGVRPAEVLPAAADAAAALTTLEASSVNVVRGEARMTVRFTAEDDDIAVQVADHVRAVTGELAEVVDVRVTRQASGRWTTVRARP
ncbi:hypothetical protein [Naasia aerilata]|uniref:Asp23/Gls24 family envelope stress response protein n=1 Tax=Naasia aerilata TaxID=1162966 RepID=A0ABN6XQV5_9MICO|nr:hypothetical protein [Naasia aerilata]BDZ47241.1 hypothetical protein GCM10025866_31500 [Naasia aerilata]